MPELPEVETVRRSLEPRLLGRTVRTVNIRRSDIVEAFSLRAGRAHSAAVTPAALLAGGFVDRLERLGKQIAIIARDGRALCVHLGMTGRLTWSRETPAPEKHRHLVWTLDAGWLTFDDPRRFGGVWAYPTFDLLRQHRWASLGPDALTISPAQLAEVLQGGRTSIKAALLDQTRLAGVGNIYADEALFLAHIAPRRLAGRLAPPEVAALAAAVTSTLRDAVAARGSTLRDYRDGEGERGSGTALHRVYGRGGKPCLVCGTPLRQATIAQRTTVWCPQCQGSARQAVPRRRGRKG